MPETELGGSHLTSDKAHKDAALVIYVLVGETDNR